MSWNPTDQQLDELKTFWTIDGLSAGQIAKHFGQTRNVIIGHIHRRGWSKTGDAPRKAYAAPAPAAPPMRKPPPPAAPAKPSPLVLEPAGFVDLDQLGPHHCRYPVDTKAGEHKGKYCGAKPNGTPYCEGHARIVYQPQQSKKHFPKGAR